MITITLIVIYVLYTNYGIIKDSFNDYFDNINNSKNKIVIKNGNKYTKDYNFNYVKNSTDYIPYNYNDLIDIYYSTFNQGWDDFTFYCPSTYTNCLEDVKTISNNKTLLSNINNFVSPFNSYSEIKTLYDSTGEVTIEVTHLYDEYERQQLYKDILSIVNNNTNDNMSDTDKIKAIHDYIINNTKYDLARADNINADSKYDSSRINGLLYEHYAICSGYADTMAVALDIMGFKNFKVSSDTHVWNAVYVDGNWLHLDLTWDDPISNSDTNKNILEHTYFLIDTPTLFSNTDNVSEHLFDDNIYSELK